MKNPYQHIKANPSQCKRLFGLEYEQWCELIELTIAHRAARRAQTQQHDIRVNAPGGGRPSKLSANEAVSLCLFYLRQHVTFHVLGLLYGVSESSAHSLYHRWLNELRQLLPASWLEELSDAPERLAHLQTVLTHQELLVDSTEQPRQRPKDNQAQEDCYSGKTKQHSFKNQIVSLSTGGEIVDVIVGEAGPVSDQELLRRQQGNFKDNQGFGADKGYQGVERTRTPVKKPPKRALSPEAIETNRAFAQDRIYIEHLIRVIKIWRIGKETFRLRCRHYETTILVICGLVRVRLGRFDLASIKLS